MLTKKIHLGLLSSILLILLSCSPINEKNFNRIENKMSKKEVFLILGQPTEQKQLKIENKSFTAATWKKDNQTILIVFFNDKVTNKIYVTAPKKKTGPN